MPAEYLIQFAQIHLDFRIPELLSVCECLGFQVDYDAEHVDLTRPFMTIRLEKEEHARLLGERCILIKGVYELWATGTTYETLHAENLKKQEAWNKYRLDTMFKFSVISFNHTIPNRRQREIINGFAYMGWEGKIDMKTPEVTLVCIEEYPERESGVFTRDWNDGQPRCIYFGRLIADGSARTLVQKFDIKKRIFYGNTSMDAEMSLLMANQAQAAPGKLIYDPFAGTGSMLYASPSFCS
jgi:tRNA (guanine10-N2)-methyltransferase